MALAEDFKLIREIANLGGHKHVVGTREQGKYRGLVELGWVTIQYSPKLTDGHYQITERGKAAALRSAR